MSRTRFILASLTVALALAVACARQAPSPTAPTAQPAVATDAAADGSTLKVTAPAPTDPVNDKQVSDSPTLTATASTGKYGSVAPSYRFQLFNAAGTMVVDSGLQSGPSYKVTSILEFKKRYTWRVRAELQNEAGPWSATASFVSPEGGYIRGDEAFDPLYNGTTVGQIVGPVTFTPDGARLETVGSYIMYAIPQTITTGEFAVEIKGLRANAPGDKSKVFGIMEGVPSAANDYITNRFRVDVQYRGTTGFPPNSITYRVLYGSATDLNVRYEPTTDQRLNAVKALDPNTYYYWRYTWGRSVRVTVQVGGPTGPFIYDVTRSSVNGTYNPQPMVAFIGTPTGRSGAESATIPGTIYRNVWISTRPRP